MLISSFLIIYEGKIKKASKGKRVPSEASWGHFLVTLLHNFLHMETLQKKYRGTISKTFLYRD